MSNNDDYNKRLKSGDYQTDTGIVKVIYSVQYCRYYLGVNVSLWYYLISEALYTSKSSTA